MEEQSEKHSDVRIMIVSYFGLDSGHKTFYIPENETQLENRRNVIGHAIDAIQKYAFATNFPYRAYHQGVVVDEWVKAMEVNACNVCIWWDYSSVSPSAFASIRERMPHVKHAVFNFDPTRNAWPLPEERKSWYDLAMVTDADTSVYTCPTFALYAPVNCDFFKPLPGVPIRYDVSFACTNLYTGLPNQMFCRANVLDDLVAVFGSRAGIFGPKSRICITPRTEAAHVGEINYSDAPWMVATSRVCLCLHGDTTVYKYLNERIVCLAACGANILTDRSLGLDEIFGDTVTYLIPGEKVSDAVNRMLLEPEDVVIDRCKRVRELAVKLFNSDKWAIDLISHVKTVLL